MSHHDVIVIGAGQAGLAIGYHLAEQGRRFTILEAADGPAAAWRSRWESLRLFIPPATTASPGSPSPAIRTTTPPATRSSPTSPTTRAISRCRSSTAAASKALRRDGDGYVVELEDRTDLAEQVVVATGPFQVPRAPEIAERLGDDVVQLHSADYRTPDTIPAGPVLVVGGGNTGFQIAEELAGSHEVHLSVGSRQMPLPQRVLGRDIFSFLIATGLMGKTVDSRIGRRMKDRDSLIGSTPRAARRLGIQIHGRATAADGATVSFEAGSSLAVTTVIWATGFGLDHSWIDAPIFDSRGAVVHQRGVTESAWLYFLGLPWQHTRAARRCSAGSRTTPPISRARRSSARGRSGRPSRPRRPRSRSA